MHKKARMMGTDGHFRPTERSDPPAFARDSTCSGMEDPLYTHTHHRTDDRAHLADVLRGEYAAGLTVRQIARRWAMTEDTVRQLLDEAERSAEAEDAGEAHRAWSALRRHLPWRLSA